MRGRNFYTELTKKDLTYSILTILLERNTGRQKLRKENDSKMYTM